jgi:hypothetical protein
MAELHLDPRLLTMDRHQDRDNHERSEERLNVVERELNGLQQRLSRLLAYIRQDDMAPLTPMVRPLFDAKEDTLD